MSKTLTQKEIDALVRGRLGGRGAGDGKQVVRPFNFQAAGRLASEQLRAVSTLHESFALNLSHSLGAYLRVSLDVLLIQVEQLPFEEFLTLLPEKPYISLLSVSPQRGLAALQIDDTLMFSFVDVLLGGIGNTASLAREATEIEETVVESVIHVICRELSAAWQPMGAQIDLQERQRAAEFHHFVAATEKILAMTFEISIAETKGVMNLLFPASVSNNILRRLSSAPDYRGSRLAQQPSNQKLRERLMDCKFPVELRIPRIKTKSAEILALRPGHVFDFHVPASACASVAIGGRDVFEAVAVRSHSQRAAQLLRSLLRKPEIGD